MAARSQVVSTRALPSSSARKQVLDRANSFAPAFFAGVRSSANPTGTAAKTRPSEAVAKAIVKRIERNFEQYMELLSGSAVFRVMRSRAITRLRLRGLENYLNGREVVL